MDTVSGVAHSSSAPSASVYHSWRTVHRKPMQCFENLLTAWKARGKVYASQEAGPSESRRVAYQQLPDGGGAKGISRKAGPSSEGPGG